MSARKSALLLAEQFVRSSPLPDSWSFRLLPRSADDEWTGMGGEVVVLELTRAADGAVGYAALTGRIPGDREQSEFVEQMQDVIIEKSNGIAWPPCPGHPHPMSPTVVDGAIEWRCPAALR